MLDTGGEFLATSQTDLSPIEPTHWYIPVHDIVGIYALAGRKVNASAIDECAVIFFAATEAVKRIADILTEMETVKSPVFEERYLDLGYGGIDSMAVWSARMAPRFVHWVEEGPPSPVPPAPESTAASGRLRMPLLRTLVETVDHAALHDLVDIERDASGGLTLHRREVRQVERRLARALSPLSAQARARLEVHMDSVSLAVVLARLAEGAQDKEEVPVRTAGLSEKHVIASGNTPLAYVGAALVSHGDFDGDGHPDVAVGAPGNGSTSLPQSGSVSVTYRQAKKEQVLSLALPYARFGAALAVLDWNIDGIDDLVVGAPVAGWNWTHDGPVGGPDYRFYGQVFVYLGHRGSGLSETADTVIRSERARNFFGAVLATGDLTGDGHADLVVGSPEADPSGGSGGAQWAERGQVTAYATTRETTTHLDVLGDALWSLNGTVAYEMLGSSLALDGGLLLVGAVGTHCVACGAHGRHVAAGGVHVYAIGKGTVTLQSIVTGDVWKGKLGAAVALLQHGSILVLGEPTHALHADPNVNKSSTVGHVYLLARTALPDSGATVALSTLSLTATLVSQDHNGRFGARLLAVASTDQLAVSSPMAHHPRLAQRTIGRVTIFNNASTTLQGTVNDCERHASLSVYGEHVHGRFGQSLAYTTNNNDTVSFLTAAPRDPTTVEMAGSVYQLT